MRNDTSVTEQRRPEMIFDLTETTNSPTQPGILVVDDEVPILALLEHVLRQQGFIVFKASDGMEAVHVFQQHHHAIDFALLDVRLPTMDGPAILGELRSQRPSLRAFFMTGDSGKYPFEDLIARGAEEIFTKPFDIQALGKHLWHLATTKPVR